MNGLLPAWYENGNKWRETHLKENKLDGVCIWYNEDGTEKERTAYKDGEPID
jgi:antitoxin component YwqK of YwqJK toxin-antitoxin module